jgi:hypothetical protein
MLTFAQLLATLLGVLCGSIMIAMLVYVPIILKKRSQKNNSEYVQNDFMPQELAHSFVAIMLTFFICSAAIFVYHLLAPDTLVWFGVTAVSWYFIGFAVYSVQKIAKERKF